MSTQLPIPKFFNPNKISEVWPVPYQERAEQALTWAKQHGIQHAAADRYSIALLVIDAQNSFCTPGFELVVSGAVDDNRRLCEFIYRNLAVITGIYPTLDTHMAMQIFHSIFVVDRSGNSAPPMSTITLEEVERGNWRANPNVAWSVAGGDDPSLQRWFKHYVRQLKEGEKYDLTIWPYHTMLGSVGHALVSVVEEAVFFHTVARFSQAGFEVKGGNALTENYSVLRPEVLKASDGTPIAQQNTRFIEKLLDFDVVIIAGQAKSHCVAWTIDDLLNEIAAKDEKLARKVYLMEDCTSPVVVPGVIDYTDQANAAFQRFADAGMYVVRSTEPISSWPNIRP